MLNLTQPFNLLDHGYVKFVEHWGDDETMRRSSTLHG